PPSGRNYPDKQRSIRKKTCSVKLSSKQGMWKIKAKPGTLAPTLPWGNAGRRPSHKQRHQLLSLVVVIVYEAARLSQVPPTTGPSPGVEESPLGGWRDFARRSPPDPVDFETR